MEFLTIEQIESLRPYENYFYTATHCDYIRALMQKDLNVIYEIWHEATGKEYKLNGACAACKLKYMKIVGELYFKSLENYEKNKQSTNRRTRKSTK